MPIAWRDYDPRQEGLREKNEKLEELVQEWFDAAIDNRDLDELYAPLGDHLIEALWDAGVSEKPFKEALKEAAFARGWRSIYDYVDSITDWDEWALP